MYRQLTSQEIKDLESKGCSSSDWLKIRVKEGFSESSCKNAVFEGEVWLGENRGKTAVGEGFYKPSGIYNSYLENCKVGDNVLISNVTILANYEISDHVAVENVGKLVVAGETSFGNGTEIEVLNEGGGRELIIFDRLSAQLAYLFVIYRHDPILTEQLKSLILAYCSTRKSKTGKIGEGATIQNTPSIINVNIGDYASITGASLLEEGTISCGRQAPVIIGENVVARKFIVLSGSEIDSGVLLNSSFVGQGVRMGKQFSSENSAFFANCEGFHGEACSLFAGPYTVTHHKSTLLIACMLSFYNAGSGTNQSNHMYKLGPVHQGILERGSKTGSFSYLLWPSRVGPFSVVMDKHGGNFDTSDFPFSYINVDNGKSVLTPAMNLFTVGTVRDSEKWPNRDRRKDPEKLDLIHFDLLNPWIIGKIINAIGLINKLQETASKNLEFVSYNGIQINRLMLKTTRRYYEIPVHVFLGQEIVNRLESLSGEPTFEEIRKAISPSAETDTEKWIDLFGLLVAESDLSSLTGEVKTGKVNSVDEIQDHLKAIYLKYSQSSYNWTIALLNRFSGINIRDITREQLIGVVDNWRSNTLKLNNMVLKDAEKEFDRHSKISYGADGDDRVVDEDFRMIRGSYDNNKFVVSLRKATEKTELKAEKIKWMIQQSG